MSITNYYHLDSFIEQIRRKMARHLLKGAFNVSTGAKNLNGNIFTTSAVFPYPKYIANNTFSDTATDPTMKGNWNNLIVKEVKPFVFISLKFPVTGN